MRHAMPLLPAPLLMARCRAFAPPPDFTLRQRRCLRAPLPRYFLTLRCLCCHIDACRSIYSR